jgi:ATP-dependent Clp protease ATP-binding subunit ClpC
MAAGTMTELSTSGLSPEATRAIDLATVMARNAGHRSVTPDHLAAALLKQSDGLASKLLRTHFGVDLFELRTRLEAGLRDLQTSLTPGALTHRYAGEPFQVAAELGQVVERARQLAVAQRKPVAGTDHLLAALLEQDSPATRTLGSEGIAAAGVEAASAGIPLPGAVATREGTVDLVAAVKEGRRPAVYERRDLLEQLANLLVQPRTSSVLLGEPGVGRRSLIQALAQSLARAPLPGLPPTLLLVSAAALLDGPELVVRQALAHARGGLLALPDLHQFFGAAALTGFAEAGVAIRQALLDGQVRVIGTSTPVLFTRYLEPDAVLRDYLRPLTVPPASEAETVEILRVRQPEMERENAVTIAAGAPATAASLARQYLPDPLPASALGLLQRASALVRLTGTALVAAPAATTPDTTVDSADVAQALHQQTGIPVGQIAGPEQERLAHMDDLLHERVIGQDAAITALTRAVRRARAGLKDPKRPIGSFLFLGPSGVGKTESALALAEFLFGSEDAVITLNMSEYMEKHSVARLVGAPPGYVGFEEGGQLTERVRQKPFAVVLLDEVEKAHPDVYDLFLQVLDQGQLQDSRGRVVSFRNTVIVMTSNLGSRALVNPELLPPGVTAKDAVLQEVRAHFRPEFLNRLDGIIVFDPLDRAALARILDLMLAKLAKQLAAQGISVEVTPEARTWLLDQHHEPAMGARPLIRIVQNEVKDALSERLIDGSLRAGQKIVMSVQNGEPTFTQPR